MRKTTRSPAEGQGNKGPKGPKAILDHVLRPTSGYTLISPKLSEIWVPGQQNHQGPKTFNETIFRVLPGLNGNGQIEPMVDDPEAERAPDRLSSFHYEADVIPSCGDKNAQHVGKKLARLCRETCAITRVSH